MPIYSKGEYLKDENLENFKKSLNQSYQKSLLFDFYMNYFTSQNEDKNKLMQMHPLITKNIFRMSKDFILAKNSSKGSLINNKEIKNSELNLDFDTILYRGLYPLDISGKNYLYLKLLKFHFGLMQFYDLYIKYNFEKLYVDENLMNDYLNKKFMFCLNEKKMSLKIKLMNTLIFNLFQMYV